MIVPHRAVPRSVDFSRGCPRSSTKLTRRQYNWTGRRYFGHSCERAEKPLAGCAC
jgi:hypothetical protein